MTTFLKKLIVQYKGILLGKNTLPTIVMHYKRHYFGKKDSKKKKLFSKML